VLLDKTNLSGASGSFVHNAITVPAGTSSLKVVLSGGTGDADLYVRQGSQPTTTTYNCRPYLNGNQETCTITNPAAGTWYVSLRGYTAYSGTNLKATATSGGGGGGPVVVLDKTGLSGASGSWQRYSVAIPTGKTTLTVRTSGGTGDADLYVRTNGDPTESAYDCRPYTSGNSETCTLNNVSGTVYIGVKGYSSYSGLSLNAVAE